MDDSQDDSSGADGMVTRNKRNRRPARPDGFVDTFSANFGSDDEAEKVGKRRRMENEPIGPTRRSQRSRNAFSHTNSTNDSEDDLVSASVTQTRRVTRAAKASQQQSIEGESDKEEDDSAGDDDEDDDSDADRIVSDIAKNTRSRVLRIVEPKVRIQTTTKTTSTTEASRRSARHRGGRTQLREYEEDEELYAEDAPVKPTVAKGTVVKEIFRSIPHSSPFRKVHNLSCDVCDNDLSINKGQLVHCQGCSTSIHQACLYQRNTRLHRVTKVGNGDFVLQCRRCIGVTAKPEPSAPVLDACQVCKEKGLACKAFSQRHTTKEEEQMRIENGGQDPIAEVSSELLNNAEVVLFRCRKCYRAYHFEHLPPLTESSETPSNIEDLRDERLYEYRTEFLCKDCYDAGDTKIQSLIAWRPLSGIDYKKGHTIDSFTHDEIEYLIKWQDKSYRKSTWMPGAWTWGVTVTAMRNAFYNQKDMDNELPTFEAENAIPEEFHIMEIILKVEYEGKYRPKTIEEGMENLEKITQVYVKFLGLDYANVVWEDPPDQDDSRRWDAYKAALTEYFRGKFFHKNNDSSSTMAKRLKEFRARKFKALDEQPEGMGSTELVLKPYQIEGMDFLRYNFHQMKNVILADDMGLGKTIQVIAFIQAMVKQGPKCWPFLIVTPNSTCPNWRREIKLWAPDLRVVAYYGGKVNRDMAKEYELYPNRDSRNLAAHVVITSFEAPVDKDGSSRFFNSVKWAGMIVDEGHRLKNDQSLLYKALTNMNTPFQCLLTGTPLQNNKRELWNLLAFLDKTKDAEALDLEYAELTEENLPEIHAQIKPFMLRRKKAEVLDLPPISQVILPTSMSVLQKQLCRSIMEKNPVLISSILSKEGGKISVKDRGNLNNIMMQLRKVLAHPFMYSARIEEAMANEEDELRNLIDASSKMQLLKIMLPKLKEKGHRVLLFSQFLDQLDLMEEFLSGIGMKYTRIDGKIGALEKQKRIDAFNAKDSDLLACLLSTRAGGVGINLATADTVIILDPDFNPHQDMQALSRAHRIGQKNKVLVFQLMTRGTVEEKIMQIGRGKMALDQALIESIKANEDEPNDVDVATILKHGAKRLFEDDNADDTIVYDAASVEKLIDRSQLETTKTDEAKTSESQFSFARVWENNKGELTNDIEADKDDETLPESNWIEILERRAREAAANLQGGEELGRGRRNKQVRIFTSMWTDCTKRWQKVINYDDPNQPEEDSPQKKGRRRHKKLQDEDGEFSGPQEASGEEPESEEAAEPEDLAGLSISEDRLKIMGKKPLIPLRPEGKLFDHKANQILDPRTIFHVTRMPFHRLVSQLDALSSNLLRLQPRQGLQVLQCVVRRQLSTEDSYTSAKMPGSI